MYATEPKRAGQPAKILILEDDLLNAFLIEDTLEFAGHKVVGPAKSIPQALTLLDSQEIDSPFERVVRSLFADGRIDESTLNALLQARREEMEENRES